MTQEAITKSFENRWRVKSENRPEAWVKGVKELCRDFFEAAIAIAEGQTVVTIHMPTVARDVYAAVGFDTFWEQYDKKVCRAKCEKLWAKLSPQEQEACLAYIPLYKQAQPDKQYRKNPETFLRNKSWNDELIYRNGNTTDNNPYEKLAAVLAP